MDTQKLNYFLAAAHSQNFRKAAIECHVAQPVLSRQIAALERELGVKLFARARQRVSLTAAGEEFVGHAGAIIDRIGLCEQAMAAHLTGLEGAVAIGAIEPLAAMLLPRALAAFNRRHPATQIAVTVRGTEELIGMVVARELDLALFGLIGASPPTSPLLTVQPLFTNPLAVALVADHELAHQPDITFEQIAGQRLALLSGQFVLRSFLDQAFASRGLRLRPALEIDNVSTLKLIVEQGIGITVLPRSLFSQAEQSGVALLPIRDLDTPFVYALLYRRDALSPAAQALVVLLGEPIALE